MGATEDQHKYMKGCRLVIIIHILFGEILEKQISSILCNGFYSPSGENALGYLFTLHQTGKHFPAGEKNNVLRVNLRPIVYEDSSADTNFCDRRPPTDDDRNARLFSIKSYTFEGFSCSSFVPSYFDSSSSAYRYNGYGVCNENTRLFERHLTCEQLLLGDVFGDEF